MIINIKTHNKTTMYSKETVELIRKHFALSGQLTDIDDQLVEKGLSFDLDETLLLDDEELPDELYRELYDME